MRKAFLLLLVLLVISASAAFIYQNKLIALGTEKVLRDVTGMTPEFSAAKLDWDQKVFTIIKPVIFSNSADRADFIAVERIDIPFQISGWNIDISNILVSGLSCASKQFEGTLVKLIRKFSEPEESNSRIKVSIHNIELKDFGSCEINIDEARISPNAKAISLHLDTKDIEADLSPSIQLPLPQAMSQLSKLKGEMAIRGKLNSPEITTKIALANIENMRLDSTFRNGIFYLSNLEVKNLPLNSILGDEAVGFGNVMASGSVDLGRLKGDLSGTASISGADIFSFKEGQCQFGVTGDRVRLSVCSLSGAAGEVKLDAESDLKFSNIRGSVRVEELTLQEKVDQKLNSVRTTAAAVINVSGNYNLINLDGPVVLNIFQERFGEGLINRLTVSSDVQLSLVPTNIHSLKGVIEISPFYFEPPNLSTTNPVRLEVGSDAVHIRKTALYIGERVVDVSGIIGLNGYDILATGSADLAPLLEFRPEIQNTQGQLKLSLKLQGELKKPILDGEISLDDGAFSVVLGEEEFRLDGIRVRARFDDSTLILTEAANREGDGLIQISGQVQDFLDPASRNGQLSFELSGGELNLSQLLNLKFHSQGELQFTADTLPKLLAKIEIDESLYEHRADLRSLLVSFFDLVLGRGKAEQSGSPDFKMHIPLDLNLQVLADRSIVVDTDIFRSELSSDLSFTTKNGRLEITGNVGTDDGELILGRNQLSVSRANLLFNHTLLGAAPKVEFRAEGDLGSRGDGDFLRLEIRGKLSDPRVILRSDSGKSQKELLAELTLGVDRLAILSSDSEVEKYRESGTRTSSLDLKSGITQGAKVEIESGYSADTGEFAPILRLERELPFDFTLVAQSEFTQTNRSELNLEYKLTSTSDYFLGWRNAPSTRNPEKSTGSFGLGVQYRERFYGTNLFPGELILENIRGLFSASN